VQRLLVVRLPVEQPILLLLDLQLIFVQQPVGQLFLQMLVGQLIVPLLDLQPTDLKFVELVAQLFVVSVRQCIHKF
jgi:hypothetical protein